MIKQDELEGYVLSCEKIKLAKAKIKLAEAKTEDAEKALIIRLNSGEKVESGDFVAFVRAVEGRASISWKDIVAEREGLAFVEKVLQDAPRPVKDVLFVEVK
jgi:hypothetical protein